MNKIKKYEDIETRQNRYSALFDNLPHGYFEYWKNIRKMQEEKDPQWCAAEDIMYKICMVKDPFGEGWHKCCVIVYEAITKNYENETVETFEIK